MLLPEFEQEMASTRKILERAPAEKFSWKPHEKSMTLGRLASHVAELPKLVVGIVNSDKIEFGTGAQPFLASSTPELLEELESNVAAARTAIAGASDEHLAQPWRLVFKGQTIFTLPRAAALRSVVMNHVIHHRGQVSVYLRLIDVPVPGMYGPSADDARP